MLLFCLSGTGRVWGQRQSARRREEREGKRVYLGSMEMTDKKLERPIRVVYQVIERTVEADGQTLVVPKIEVQVFFTTLRCPPWQVIKLFRDHATSGSFTANSYKAKATTNH